MLNVIAENFPKLHKNENVNTAGRHEANKFEQVEYLCSSAVREPHRKRNILVKYSQLNTI